MISAGRVMMIPKGDWVYDVDYQLLDVVIHNRLSWICKKLDVRTDEESGEIITSCYNQEPALDSEYWQPICVPLEDTIKDFNTISAENIKYNNSNVKVVVNNLMESENLTHDLAFNTNNLALDNADKINELDGARGWKKAGETQIKGSVEVPIEAKEIYIYYTAGMSIYAPTAMIDDNCAETKAYKPGIAAGKAEYEYILIDYSKTNYYYVVTFGYCNVERENLPLQPVTTTIPIKVYYR